MWVADMDFACAPEIVAAIKERAAHPIYGYTSRTDGYYNGMINWMAKRNGWKDVKRDWILSSPGVVPGFNYSIQAYSHPGDKVIIQPPVYYPFKNAILNNGRQVVDNPLKIVDGYYQMDYEDLEKKIDARTKMLIFCSPHNPVGRVWKRDELKHIVEICEKKDIIIDQRRDTQRPHPRQDQAHLHRHRSPTTPSMRTVTLTAPNKTFNIAGLQNADAIIPNPKLRAAFLNVTTNNSVSNPNIFGMVAQEAAYAKGEPWLEECLKYLKANLAYFEDYIKKNMPMLKVYPLEGTYLAWVDCGSTRHGRQDTPHLDAREGQALARRRRHVRRRGQHVHALQHRHPTQHPQGGPRPPQPRPSRRSPRRSKTPFFTAASAASPRFRALSSRGPRQARGARLGRHAPPPSTRRGSRRRT